MRWIRDKRIWLYLIFTLIVINTAIAIFTLSHDMPFSFGQIFFIPIIFTAYFYPRRGVLFAFTTGILYLLINVVFFQDPVVMSRVFLEFALYVGIGGIISLFSENLVEEKDRYLSIFDISEAAILLISRETHQILESNPRFASLIRHQETEIKGTPFSRFWQSEEPFGSFLDRIRPDGPVVDYEARLRAGDGTTRHVLISGRLADQHVVVLTLIDISERKKAQIALERSEERYRNVVEDQTEFISRFRPDGTHVFANEAYLRYFGLNREEVIGKKFAPALFPEDRERMRVHISSLTRENPAATIEHRIIMPDGSVRWQQWSDRAIFDEAGRLVEYQSVGRDITERKEAERTDAYLAAIVQSSLDAIIGTSIEGTIVSWNPAAQAILGYTAAEMIGRDLAAILAPEALHLFPMIQGSLSRGREFEGIETRAIRRDGRIIDVVISISLIRDPGQAVIGASTSIRDITERKRAQEALRESEQLFETLSRVSPAGIFRAAPSGDWVYVNERWSEITGVPPEKAMGKGWTEAVHPEDRTLITGQWSESVEEKRSFNRDFRMLRPDGSVRWVLGQAQAEKTPSGEVTGYVGVITDITERVHAQNTIYESELKYRMVFDNANDAIFIHDFDGRFLEVNRAACERLGYTREEMLHMSLRDIDTPEFRPLIGQRMQTILDRGHLVLEAVHIRKDGSQFPVESNARLIEFGGKPAILSIIRDISERKKMERALQEREKQYRLLAENSQDIISLHDLDWNFRYISPACEPLLGYGPEELIGRNLFELMDPDTDRAAIRTLVTLERGTGTETLQLRLRHRNGSYSWFETIAHSVVDPATGKVSEFHATSRDIMGRRRAEEALEKSQANFRTVVENVPDLILVHRNGILLYVNPSASRVMEYTPDELLNTHFSAYIAPGDLPRVAAAMQERMAGEPIEPYEIEVITKSGVHRTVLVSGSRIDYVGGPASLNVLTDVTERIRYENNLMASLKEKEVLLKEVHHRVKNNMQVISSLLSLQANSIRDPTDLVYFQECERRVRAMALVHEKLYQSKDLSGVSARDYLGNLVNDLVTTYSLAAEIRIQLELEEIPLDLDMAIPCGLIVNELVTNALKYAFKGRNRGVLTVGIARVPEHRYSLTVQDDGVGFPPGLDLSMAETLGLKLVWVLSQQLDGDVRVESASGTRFFITFPEKAR